MAYISIYHSQPLPIWLVCSSFATAGALSHLLYFIHGTHIHNTVDIAIFYLGMTSMLYVGALAKYHFMQGLVFATAACASYFTALFASMTVYRLWFHPLSSFPGPRLAAVTKFYGPWIARNGRMHWEHQVLWRKHGKFVRIGLCFEFRRWMVPAHSPIFKAPDELLVESIDAIQKVHGSGSGCSKKDTSYSFVSVNGIHNLDSVDDHGIHRARRVFWDKAFSSKGMRCSYLTRL